MGNRNTTSESSIEKYFVQKCKEHGFKTHKMVPTFECGVPDRQVRYEGIVGYCELKKPGVNKAEPHQIAYIKELEKGGFYVGFGVVNSKESVIQWIEGFKQYMQTKFKVIWTHKR